MAGRDRLLDQVGTGGPGHPVDWTGWLAVAALVGVVVGCLCVLLGWSS